MRVDKLMLAMSDVNQIGMTSAPFRDDVVLAAEKLGGLGHEYDQ